MGKITSEWLIETAGAQSSIAELARSVAGYNETLGKSQDAGKKAFNDSAKAAKDFNRELSNGTQIYQKIGASAGSFRAEIKRLESVYSDLRKNQTKFVAEGKYDELQKNIAGVKGRISELKNELGETTKEGGLFSNVLDGMKGQLLGIASIGAIVGLGKQIFDTTAEFQKFDAVLTNTLGSGSAAERSMFMIQDFAAKTPFSVAELTDSYVKLANKGIRPTTSELTALGDLASSTGKSFDQLTEATLDAMTGENERLKEFGVTAQKSGEKTFYTFKGVTTEVQNTDSAIKDYLISLGNVEGVSGSMNAISQTLTGQVSNLGDSFDKLFLTLGNQQTGVMGGTISVINDMVNALQQALASTEQLGKERASKAVTEYATKVTEQFKKVASEAKAAGKDIKEALDLSSLDDETRFKKKLVDAEADLKAFKEKTGSLASVANEFLNPSVGRSNRAHEADLAERVARLQGKLAAIDDAKRDTLKVGASGVDPEALKAAEKAAKEAAKKAAAEKKKALADLQKELLDLEKEAAKARLNMLDKNSKEYQDALLASRRKEIALIKTHLEETSRKAGKGGKLGAAQNEQLGILDKAAVQDYNEAIMKINQEQADKLLDLQKDSDEKVLLQIVSKYQKQIDAARKAKNEELAVALEKARELELAATGQAQGLANIDSGEALAISKVQGGNFVSDSLDPAAIEKAKQEAILSVQIDFAKKRLALLEAIGGDENKLIIQNTKNIIGDLEKDLENSKGKKKPFDILALLGVKEGDREEVKKAFAEVVGFVTEFTQAQLAAANELVDQRTNEVEQKRADLNTEIALNKEGFASNVENKRAELEASKKLRAEALADQKRAQKAQAAVETITQTVGLITSSVDIIKGFSKIPIIGLPLGIAAVAAMFGSFVAAKAKAAKATKMERGGILGGRRHSQGGNRFTSDNGDTLEHESGEFFVNRNATAKRLEWLEAINKDDEESLRALSLRELLKGTGVTTAKNAARKIQDKSNALSIASLASPLKLQTIENELIQIRKNTASGGLQYEDEHKKVYQSGNVTRTIRKN